MTGFRDAKSEKNVALSNTTRNLSFDKLLKAVQTIPIFSAECERGFSGMNSITGAKRNHLLVENVSSLMFIKLNGPPMSDFDPKPYACSLLASGRSSNVNILEARHGPEF